MPAFTEIPPAQLMRLIGSAEAPFLVDVCSDEDFNQDPFLVPTAVRRPFTSLQQITDLARGRHTVVICQKGKKLSHGVAAQLRSQGMSAEVLSGGNLGWKAANLPRCDVSALPTVQFGGSKWVTRHRPKIDRIACPWLIRRFIDPTAEFLFVPPAEVSMVADKFEATVFDIEDAFWSHKGDHCTFDTMIAGFGLAHSALDRLATVVRAADTDQHHLAPQAAGVLAISVGLSRMYKNDTQQLDAGMMIYDALYRWARDGFEEGHDWPAPASKGKPA